MTALHNINRIAERGVALALERGGPALGQLGATVLERALGAASFVEARKIGPPTEDKASPARKALAAAVEPELVRAIMRGADDAALEADRMGRPRRLSDDEPVLALREGLVPGTSAVFPKEGVDNYLQKPFNEAIAYFARRKVLPPETFYALEQAARRKAFTVSFLAEQAQVATVMDSLEAALEEGLQLDEWKADLRERFVEAGWTDEEPGGLDGSPGWHAETVFRTNVMGAYSEGRRAQMESVIESRPYWRTVGIDDHRTRETHREAQGVVLAADDAAWDTKFPPWGYNCRCTVDSLSERDMERLGLEEGEASDLDGVPDEGWTTEGPMELSGRRSREVWRLSVDAFRAPMLLGAGEWSEDDHPRDERGRFASGAGGDGVARVDVAPVEERKKKILAEIADRGAQEREGRRPSAPLAGARLTTWTPYRRDMWAPEAQPPKTKEEAANLAARLFTAHLAGDELEVSRVVQNGEMELALARQRAELKGRAFEDALRYLWRTRDTDYGPSLLASSLGRGDSLTEDEYAAAREEWASALTDYFETREPSAPELRNLAAGVWEKNATKIRDYLPSWGDPGATWDRVDFEKRGFPLSEKERAMAGRAEAALTAAAEHEDTRHVGWIAEQEYRAFAHNSSAPLGSKAFIDALEKRIHDRFVKEVGREPPDGIAGGQASWVTEHYGTSSLVLDKGWSRVGAMTPDAFGAVEGVAKHPVIAEVLDLFPLRSVVVETIDVTAGGAYDYRDGKILIAAFTQPEMARAIPLSGFTSTGEPWTVGMDGRTSQNRSPTGGMHSVLIHELGHHVMTALERRYPEDEARAKALLGAHAKPDTRLSAYSATNHREFEAEAFAAYIEDPADLAKRFPDIHAFVRDGLLKLGVQNPDARPKPRQWEYLQLSAQDPDEPGPRGEPVDVEAWLDLWREIRETAEERPLTPADLEHFAELEEALGVEDHEALATFASAQRAEHLEQQRRMASGAVRFAQVEGSNVAVLG